GPFDKAVIYAGLVFSIGTLVWGIYLVLGGEPTFGAVAAFFGLIFLVTVRKDFQEFVQGKPVRKLSGHQMQWYFEHFGRMYISYIAAMTAFTVIQEVFPIAILNWILPTVVGTVLIAMSNRKYYQQFNIEK
ncbi:MAG: hypothetical protein IT258_09100, partial [Saprospiraceae bacterium]|nr:hypothetical protein [Saprospiraceae bacterium]